MHGNAMTVRETAAKRIAAEDRAALRKNERATHDNRYGWMAAGANCVCKDIEYRIASEQRKAKR